MDMTNAEVKDQSASESMEKEAPPPESIEEQFESDSYSRNLLSSHMKLRCDGYLCDVTIRFGNSEIKAHRIILASATEYFKAMFMNETKEAKTGIINFPKIPSEVVKKCIEFIYSGKVKISMETVQSLLDTAEMMQLPELCELCINFLAKSINLANCAEIITLSCLYCKKSLDSPIKTFLMENFEEFSKTEDFSALDLQPVAYCMDLVRDNSPQQEKLIWDAIVAWVEHDYDGRKSHFDLLFENVDLSCFSKKFVREDILSLPVVSDSAVCVKKIAMCNVAESSPPFTEDVDEYGPKAYFCHQDNSQVIVGYEPLSGKWSPVCEFPGTFSHSTDVISHRGSIFVGDGESLYQFYKGKWKRAKVNQNSSQKFCRCVGIGGSVYMVISSGIFQYDIAKSSFAYHDFSGKFRNEFFITASQHKIYIMNCNNYKSAYAFDVEANTCFRLCDMLGMWQSGFAFWHDFKVFMFVFKCGYRGNYEYFEERSVECYDPKMDSWGKVEGVQFIPSTLNVKVSNKLYLFGNNLSDNCEIIDLEKLKVSDMTITSKKCFFTSV